MAENCEKCKLRAKYDQKPNSFLGKFWRWHINLSPIHSLVGSGVLALASDHRSSGHINFCPGWKGYFTSLSEEQKKELRAKYNFQKY